jgi:hypothetical protein
MATVSVRRCSHAEILPLRPRRRKLTGSYYALEREGRIVSFGMITPRRTGTYIGDVYTLPEERQRGYYRLLISALVELYGDGAIEVLAVPMTVKGFGEFGFKIVGPRLGGKLTAMRRPPGVNHAD